MNKTSSSQIMTQLNALMDNPKVVIGVAVAVLLLDVVFVMRFQIGGLGRVFSETSQLNTQIRQVRIDARQRTTNRDKLDNLKNEFACLNKQVLNIEEVPVALEAISKNANNTGVWILRIKPLSLAESQKKAPAKGAAAVKEEFDRQRISISLKAGFHELGRFVALLENSDIFYNIVNIEIISDQQEFTKQSVTILLEVFVRKA